MTRSPLTGRVVDTVVRPRRNAWELRRVRAGLRSLLADLDTAGETRGRPRHDVALAHQVVRAASDRLSSFGPGSHFSTAPLTGQDKERLNTVLAAPGVDLATSPDRQHEWLASAGALLADSLLRGNVHLLAQVATQARGAVVHELRTVHVPGLSHDPKALLNFVAWTAAEAGSCVRNAIRETTAPRLPVSPAARRVRTVLSALRVPR